jgi:hypothetical protein
MYRIELREPSPGRLFIAVLVEAQEQKRTKEKVVCCGVRQAKKRGKREGADDARRDH